MTTNLFLQLSVSVSKARHREFVRVTFRFHKGIRNLTSSTLSTIDAEFTFVVLPTYGEIFGRCLSLRTKLEILSLLTKLMKQSALVPKLAAICANMGQQGIKQQREIRTALTIVLYDCIVSVL